MVSRRPVSQNFHITVALSEPVAVAKDVAERYLLFFTNLPRRLFTLQDRTEQFIQSNRHHGIPSKIRLWGQWTDVVLPISILCQFGVDFGANRSDGNAILKYRHAQESPSALVGSAGTDGRSATERNLVTSGMHLHPKSCTLGIVLKEDLTLPGKWV